MARRPPQISNRSPRQARARAIGKPRTPRVKRPPDNHRFESGLHYLTWLNATSFWYPDFLASSAWLDHAPFAFFITSILRPHILVELGTHGGYSYFAFCQAVKALGLNTRSYAIDTWKGDDHAGFYGEEVFVGVRDYNDRHYATFSRLVRSTFDQALSHFPDASVDLLHIDGRHFYEDVKHDFESWRPKLSDRSIVLLHDTNVREKDFGVFNLWLELASHYPSFEFLHGHGLGVLGYGANLTQEVTAFFAAANDSNIRREVREAYSRLGAAVKADFEAAKVQKRLKAKLKAQAVRSTGLAARLETRDAEAKDLTAKLQAQETATSHLEASLERRDAEAKDLTAKLRAQEAATSHLEASLERRDAEAKDLTAKLQAKKTELQELKASLKASAGRLEDVATKLRLEKTAARDLEARLEKRNAEAKDLTAKLRAQETMARSLEVTLRARGLDISALSAKLQASTKLASDRKSILKARKQEIQKLKTSVSWRITKPLRATSRVLRWLVQNARNTIIQASSLVTRDSTRAVADRARSMPLRAIPLSDKAIVSSRAECPKGDDKISYSEWIDRNDRLSADDRLLIRSHISSFKYKPKFSILMHAHDASSEYLRKAITSLFAQLYQEWELCIVDASRSNDVRLILEEPLHKDARLRRHYLDANAGLSECLNSALDMASGDWIILMGPNDVLSEHALYLVAEALNRHPNLSILYADEDQIDERGIRSNPYFKPDWDYELFLGNNLVGHSVAYQTQLARQIGGFREKFEDVKERDFALRALEVVPNARIHHIPFVLYSQRHKGARGIGSSRTRMADAAQRAVNEHFRRTAQFAVAIPEGYSDHLRIRWKVPAERPLVSIVIPSRDKAHLLATCVDDLLSRTNYKPIEIIIVDNGSEEQDAVSLLADLRTLENVRIVEDAKPFNFSRLINTGVTASSGDVCILLNNDIRVINADWLCEMISHALRPEVGVVGAKLYYPNDTLQHAGVILGCYNVSGSVAGHAHHHAPRDARGYFNRLNLTNNVSCVTAACLAVRRNVFNAVGGFNERDLAVSYNDVDFCLRVRRAGYKVIWTPNAELYHIEKSSRGDPQETIEKSAQNSAERAYMREQWSSVLENDPFYNPNLSLRGLSFQPTATPRVKNPWWEFQYPPSFSLKQEIARALLTLSKKRLDLSLVRRLSHIDAYKHEIAKYASARAAKNRQLIEEKKIVIYTAILGNYDSIKLPERLDSRFEYVLFTNTPAPETGVWQVRPITYFDNDKTRAARFVKMHPHALMEGYDLAVWIDSSIMILGDINPLVDEFLRSGKALAAVPHPLRESIYEEVEACTKLMLDDPETMREQVACYRQAGFEHGLIESNLMMFNLRDERLAPVLDAWWREIERYSKRDQLSLNYVLAQSRLEWHRLTQHPNSIRNHPTFALVRHDADKSLESALIEMLNIPTVDPYVGTSYAQVRQQRIGAQKHRKIDIVVCVHNAPKDVELCLEAISRARKSEHHRLILIDDGSDLPTATYLETFAKGASWVELHRNAHPCGYTKAANQGLAAATGELVILLNSDTIVTDGWAEKMADAVFSTPGAGIVGPISNAASHQSVPDHQNVNGQTAINYLPLGLTAEDMNRYCEAWTVEGLLPRVPLVHGFCFGVTRKVIDKIGSFDEDSFPIAYGEENDYCFRATDAGFGLVIATHTYVFHRKSKSHAEAERAALVKAGSQALKRLHGRRIERAVKSMEKNPFLVNLREHIRNLTHFSVLGPSGESSPGEKRSILALVPQPSKTLEGTSYIRILRPLQHSSLCQIAGLTIADQDSIGLEAYDALLIQRDGVRSLDRAKQVIERCQERKIRLFYEIDDDLLHLPDNHPGAVRYSPVVKEAMLTIAQHADVVIVSTAELRKKMTAFNRNVVVLPNALDEGLWQRTDNRLITDRNGQVKILYMGTRTHDDDLALVADPIRRLKEKYGNRATFTCIGAFNRNPPDWTEVENVPEWVRTYPQFANWMVQSCDYDIAIAPLNDTEFNRCKSYIKYLDYGICGFAPVLSDLGQYRGVVRHGETAIIVDNQSEAWFDALCALIEDPVQRDALRRNAREDVLTHHTLESQAEGRQRVWREILAESGHGDRHQQAERAEVSKARALLLGNDLFDADWYLKSYPDVAAAGVDPLHHYLFYGAAEGRDPGPNFNTRIYLTRNPDVAARGVNPLVHYLKFGRAEGRQITPAEKHEKRL
jgi:GT2 family glycosyltransferase/glycosyltransferase involved in cell wall biosynthesis